MRLTTRMTTLSLPDALPISVAELNRLLALRNMEHTRLIDPIREDRIVGEGERIAVQIKGATAPWTLGHESRRTLDGRQRSEEHTSELQSRQYLVCRLLLEKK